MKTRRQILKSGALLGLLPFVDSFTTPSQASVEGVPVDPKPIPGPNPFKWTDWDFKYPTGFPEIDPILDGGFTPGSLVVILTTRDFMNSTTRLLFDTIRFAQPNSKISRFTNSGIGGDSMLYMMRQKAGNSFITAGHGVLDDHFIDGPGRLVKEETYTQHGLARSIRKENVLTGAVTILMLAPRSRRQLSDDTYGWFEMAPNFGVIQVADHVFGINGDILTIVKNRSGRLNQQFRLSEANPNFYTKLEFGQDFL